MALAGTGWVARGFLRDLALFGVPVSGFVPSSATQTRLRRELSGGIVFYCGIYQMDMLRAFFGRFQSVQDFCAASNSLPYYPPDVPDQVFLALGTVAERAASFEIFHNRAPCWYRPHLGMPVKWETMPGRDGTEGAIGADCDVPPQ